MAELKIPQVILRERRKKNITQEELAEAIGVTAQAVSNWERGGYPDITLLPRIAAYFGITTDVLLGSDEATVEEEISDFGRKFWAIPATKHGWCERLVIAEDFYEKYPENFDVMNLLGYAIVNNLWDIEETGALLSEIHRKIMSGCTDEEYRRESIHRMCIAASDEELEERIGQSELNWQEAISIGELREDRFLLQGRLDEYRRERSATDLLVFMHYLGRREYPVFENEYPDIFAESRYTEGRARHRMRLLESFSPGEVPQAWWGVYAQSCLDLGGALVAQGETEEGLDALERAVSFFEKWHSVPAGSEMPVGCPEVFGGATVNKSEQDPSYITVGERRVWAPYTWLFGWLEGKFKKAFGIVDPATRRPCFDAVADDPRFGEICKKVRDITE